MSNIGEEVKALGSFFRDCRTEFGKIAWPKRKELVDSTWVVAAVIMLLSLFVFVSDQVLTQVLKLAMGAN